MILCHKSPFEPQISQVTDVGTEELSHLEMIGTIVYQLTRNLSFEEIKKSGFDTYFVDHTTGVYPTAAGGSPERKNQMVIIVNTLLFSIPITRIVKSALMLPILQYQA